MNIRLPAELIDRLEAAANRNNRAFKAEVVSRLQTYDSLLDAAQEHAASAVELRADIARMNAELAARHRAILALEANLPKLPPGLTSRINRAAVAHGRTTAEEILQALEGAFPPPTAPDLSAIESVLEMLERAPPLPGQEESRQHQIEALRQILDNPSAYDVEEVPGGVLVDPKDKP